MEKQFRTFPTAIRGIDEKARTIEFVASSEAVDRMGDILKADGWVLDNFRRNPSFLFAHRSDQPPVGQVTNIGVDVSTRQLIAKVKFADAKTYPFADTVFRLYQGKFLRAVSVGFLPLERPERREHEDGDDDMRLGFIFPRNELLELSAVPVPANPEALARSIEKGIITEEEMKEHFAEPPKRKHPDDTGHVGLTETNEIDSLEKLATALYGPAKELSTPEELSDALHSDTPTVEAHNSADLRKEVYGPLF